MEKVICALGAFTIVMIALCIKSGFGKGSKWYDNDVIPRDGRPYSGISHDIVIRDLKTEREFVGYFEYDRGCYYDNKGHMISGMSFIWRYK